MDKENKNVCIKCNKTFSTKYTLKNHIETKVCESKNEYISIKCLSNRCLYQTQNRYDLQKHLKTCKHIEMDSVVDKIKEEHNKETEKYKKEIEDLNK